MSSLDDQYTQMWDEVLSIWTDPDYDYRHPTKTIPRVVNAYTEELLVYLTQVYPDYTLTQDAYYPIWVARSQSVRVIAVTLPGATTMTSHITYINNPRGRYYDVGEFNSLLPWRTAYTIEDLVRALQQHKVDYAVSLQCRPCYYNTVGRYCGLGMELELGCNQWLPCISDVVHPTLSRP